MQKTLYILIDGLRTDAFETANTPGADRLRKRGCYFPDVRTVSPPQTLPAHFTIFSSLPPLGHGVMNNTGLPDPCSHSQNLFLQVKNQGKSVSAFYSWEHLRNLAPAGTLDHSLHIRVQTEADLSRLADNALAHLEDQSPDFCFLYLEWTDIVGHKSGWMSRDYIKAVETCDQALSRFLHLMDRPDAPYTLVMGSDHGGEGYHHMEPGPGVDQTPLVMAGPQIPQGTVIDRPASLTDIAPTLAANMGVPPHFAWEGRNLLA